MPRILIVDDDSAIRSLLRRGLTLAGYSVTLASDGEEALASTRQELPDLIVLERDFGSPTVSKVLTALHWFLRDCLNSAIAQHLTPLLLVAPTTLKKFVTGRGNADKPAMVAAIVRQWGGELPAEANTDELEAYALARLGRCWLLREASGEPDYRISAVKGLTAGKAKKPTQTSLEWPDGTGFTPEQAEAYRLQVIGADQ